MKILHVAPYFYGAWAYGGIPRLAWHLAAAQAALGHQVEAVTTDVCDATHRLPGGDYEREGVRVRVHRNLSNALAYHLQFFTPTAARAERVRIRDYDVVHVHGHRNFLNSAMIRFACRRRVPVALMPNGTFVNIERRRRLKEIYDLLLGKAEVGMVSGFVAVAEAERDQMMHLGIDTSRIRVIPDGVEMECDSGDRNFKREFGITGDYVLYLGKITPRKGIDHLIRALPLLRDPDLILVVVGNDMGYQAKLLGLARKMRVEGRVRFTGLVTGELKAAAYREARVTVYAGRDEIFGLVPWESIMCGTPVIVADDCGCGEWVRAGRAGQVVRYAAPEALAAAIDARAPERDRAAVERGQAFCRDRLSWTRIAAEMVEYYRSLR